MELKIRVQSKPDIVVGAEGINGHLSTKEERDYCITEFKKRNMNHFVCAIGDNVDIERCYDLVKQGFDIRQIDYDSIELVDFKHSWDGSELDFTVVIGLKEKDDNGEDLQFNEEQLHDYVHDWMYFEGAHIWLIDPWWGVGDVECYYTVETNLKNTAVTIELIK